MTKFIRSHPLAVVVGALATLGAVAWVAIGYFGVHTLFFDEEVSEAAPVFDASPPDSATVDATPPTPPSSASPASPADRSAPAAPAPMPDPMDGPRAEVEPSSPPSTPTSTTAPSEPVIEYSGEFVSEAHPTSGTATVLGNGTGQRFLRLEGFATDNGPDLNVYLVNSATGDVSDYVDLGDLKGNIGDQNYEIPPTVDLDVYDTVAIWCVRFAVGFGNATLAAA